MGLFLLGVTALILRLRWLSVKRLTNVIFIASLSLQHQFVDVYLRPSRGKAGVGHRKELFR